MTNTEQAAQAVTGAANAAVAAQQALRQAIIAADKAGVARNEIARRAKPAMSRPVVLAELGGATILEKAMEVLSHQSRLGSLDYLLAIGTGSKRPVLLTIYTLRGNSGLVRANDIEHALRGAGLGLADPDSGWTANTTAALAAGETLEVYEL